MPLLKFQHAPFLCCPCNTRFGVRHSFRRACSCRIAGPSWISIGEMNSLVNLFPSSGQYNQETKHFFGTRNPISKTGNDSQEHLNCNPDERPMIHSPKSLHRARFNFRLVQRNATCVDGSNLDYQIGVFEPVQDSTECAEMCVNHADMRLQPHLAGISFLCTDQECQCLYPAGALNEQNAGPFNRTNWGTSGRKGTGPINNYANTTRANASCFNLISRTFF